MNEIDAFVFVTVTSFLGFILFITSYDNRIRRWLFSPVLSKRLQTKKENGK